MHIMERYGVPLTLCRGTESWQVRAFFQPVRSKSWDYSDSNYSPLGEIPRGRYIYIGPVEPELREDMEVTAGEKHCVVRSVHLIAGDNGPVYCWALCVEKGRENGWNSNS